MWRCDEPSPLGVEAVLRVLDDHLRCARAARRPVADSVDEAPLTLLGALMIRLRMNFRTAGVSRAPPLQPYRPAVITPLRTTGCISCLAPQLLRRTSRGLRRDWRLGRGRRLLALLAFDAANLTPQATAARRPRSRSRSPRQPSVSCDQLDIRQALAALPPRVFMASSAPRWDRDSEWSPDGRWSGYTCVRRSLRRLSASSLVPSSTPPAFGRLAGLGPFVFSALAWLRSVLLRCDRQGRRQGSAWHRGHHRCAHPGGIAVVLVKLLTHTVHRGHTFSFSVFRCRVDAGIGNVPRRCLRLLALPDSSGRHPRGGDEEPETGHPMPFWARCSLRGYFSVTAVEVSAFGTDADGVQALTSSGLPGDPAASTSRAAGDPINAGSWRAHSVPRWPDHRCIAAARPSRDGRPGPTRQYLGLAQHPGSGRGHRDRSHRHPRRDRRGHRTDTVRDLPTEGRSACSVLLIVCAGDHRGRAIALLRSARGEGPLELVIPIVA